MNSKTREANVICPKCGAEIDTICPSCGSTNFKMDYLHEETFCVECGLVI